MNLPDLTDFEIWSSFKKGDDGALSFIYAENSVKLYRYGLKFTSDIYLVEDSIQDLFSELIKNRKTLGNTDNILFYLLKSFKRKLLKKLQVKNNFDQKENIEGKSFDLVWSIEHDIISEEVSKEKSTQLLKAMKELTPRQKEAIYLRFSRELDYKEVAGIMDISVEACRNLISKAIKKLKEKVTSKG